MYRITVERTLVAETLARWDGDDIAWIDDVVGIEVVSANTRRASARGVLAYIEDAVDPRPAGHWINSYAVLDTRPQEWLLITSRKQGSPVREGGEEVNVTGNEA